VSSLWLPSWNLHTLKVADWKTCVKAQIGRKYFTNPTFFVFKICIPPYSMYCKNFGKFHRKKFKKITNKAIKTVNNAFVWAFINQHQKPRFEESPSKSAYHHCLLHLVSLRGLGVNKNAKTAFKT